MLTTGASGTPPFGNLKQKKVTANAFTTAKNAIAKAMASSKEAVAQAAFA